MPTTTLRRLGALPLALGLILAGCSSDPGPGEHKEGFAGHSKPPTPMAGHESFFDHQLLAEITVGTDGLPEGAGEGTGTPNGGSGGGRGRRGGGGGMSVRGGTGGGVGGNLSGNIPFGGGGDRPARSSSDDDGGGYRGPRAMPAGRPVMIHLRFTNQGTTSMALTIDDFASPLGNFAVRPENLVIEPGQTVETEPMSSQLAGLYSETDATLVLRLGGKAEKKTFTLHAVAPPPAPPAEPAKPTDDPAK